MKTIMIPQYMNKLFIPLFAILLLIPSSCVDLEYDQPPAGGEDPNLPVNITIAELKSRHTLDQYEEITDDATLAGLVVSDDTEDNFFKQLVIQDATGGIEMRIEMSDLHNVYPVGRKVYVKLKGLWLGDYNGLIQLGAGEGVDDNGKPELIRIPESLVAQYIVPATYGNVTTPKTLTIGQLSLADVSTLVRFENVQFISSDAGQTYADSTTTFPDNSEVEDCAKNKLIIRTSDFASFARDLTPTENGSLEGILSIFGDVYQITIRSLEDVDMQNNRCNSGTGELTSINAIKQLYTGSTMTLPAGSIKGVIISDFESNSVTGKNMYIQDATGGITIRFTATHFFALGSEITLDITGGQLGEFNGLLQIDGLTTGAGSVSGNPGDVTPRIATVNEILTNAQAWESTLVKINNATLTPDSTYYNGTVVVSDGTGSMVLFTRTQAYFSHTAVPTGEVSITAILSENFAPQLVMRNLSDVVGGSTGGGDDLDEDFTGLLDDVDIALPGWSNIAVKGTRLWRSQVFQSNVYAQATAYLDAASEMESWLITPPIMMDVAKKITFESAYASFVQAGLTVWISSDFDGTDVTGATWQQLSPVLAMSGDTQHAFIPSGDVGLAGFGNPVRIGFKYVGSGPGGQTSSFRIDNVKVEKL
ncbi:MAG: choice-of-anchor J domain-containing protein [Saprospiraceae bacterium]|nr:choice-of-anchor J domain-containing protein [Saprospiraceae bacterium]